MNIPSRLYRYEAITLQSLENLKAQAIYFAPPLSFNDPYDCALSPSLTDLTRDDLQNVLIEYEKNSGEVIAASSALLNPDSDVLRLQLQKVAKRVIDETQQDFLTKRGVSCFSEKNDNLLMWSHYGGHCKGICLEFDTKDELFKKAKKVDYLETMPVINSSVLFREKSYDEIVQLYHTKSLDWSYEREWRCIHSEAKTLFHYAAANLTGVYFGPEISDKVLEIVCLILQGQNEHVKFWRGKRSQTHFRVDYLQIEYKSYIQSKREGLR